MSSGSPSLEQRFFAALPFARRLKMISPAAGSPITWRGRAACAPRAAGWMVRRSATCSAPGSRPRSRCCLPSRARCCSPSRSAQPTSRWRCAGPCCCLTSAGPRRRHHRLAMNTFGNSRAAWWSDCRSEVPDRRAPVMLLLSDAGGYEATKQVETHMPSVVADRLNKFILTHEFFCSFITSWNRKLKSEVQCGNLNPETFIIKTSKLITHP